jgi:adenine-specific DNA-methyltransferase
MPVGPCFADLASNTAKLIIELDGGQHCEAAEYDHARARLIETLGDPVRCFCNKDALSNPDLVLERIGRSIPQARGQLEAPQ